MILDFTMLIDERTPVYPGDPQQEIRQLATIRENGWNEKRITINSHFSTHIDAPFHFLPNGKTFSEIPLEILMGEVHVFSVPDADVLDVSTLEKLDIPRGIRRVLFKTKNSDLWKRDRTTFFPEFVALSSEGASWIVSRCIELVGIDYLSIQLFGDRDPQTHRVLLQAGVVILEGLDLGEVSEGVYTLYCLPLRMKVGDGAPARAILVGSS